MGNIIHTFPNKTAGGELLASHYPVWNQTTGGRDLKSAAGLKNPPNDGDAALPEPLAKAPPVPGREHPWQKGAKEAAILCEDAGGSGASPVVCAICKGADHPSCDEVMVY